MLYIYIVFLYSSDFFWHHDFVINNVLCVINNYMSFCLPTYLSTYHLSTYLFIYNFCITLQHKFPMILLLHMDVTWWWCWWQWWCSVVVFFFCVEVWRRGGRGEEVVLVLAVMILCLWLQQTKRMPVVRWLHVHSYIWRSRWLDTGP